MWTSYSSGAAAEAAWPAASLRLAMSVLACSHILRNIHALYEKRNADITLPNSTPFAARTGRPTSPDTSAAASYGELPLVALLSCMRQAKTLVLQHLPWQIGAQQNKEYRLSLKVHVIHAKSDTLIKMTSPICVIAVSGTLQLAPEKYASGLMFRLTTRRAFKATMRACT